MTSLVRAFAYTIIFPLVVVVLTMPMITKKIATTKTTNHISTTSSSNATAEFLYCVIVALILSQVL